MFIKLVLQMVLPYITHVTKIYQALTTFCHLLPSFCFLKAEEPGYKAIH